MNTPTEHGDAELRELEGIAMNIVHQIGDALYEALPKDIAHDHFVKARQATNDTAIEFAKKLIKARDEQRVQAIKGLQTYLLHADSSEKLVELEDVLATLTNPQEQDKEVM